MAKFDELMAKIEDSELKGEIETAYLQSLESRDAKIESLETTRTELDTKVKEYAVANFDLIRKADTSGDKTPPGLNKQEQTENKLMPLNDLVSKMRGK